MVTANTVTTEIVETDPNRVEQGDTATVFVRVSNTGEDVQQNIDLVATPPEGVSLVRSDQRVTSIRSIGGFQERVIPYEVYIDEDAPTGTLSFTFRLNKEDSSKTQTAPLNINRLAEQLEVRSVRVSPSPMEPGQEGELTLQIGNQGKSTIRNLNLELSIQDTPLRPVGESNVISIPRLQGEQTHSVSLPITTPPETDSGLYDIPIAASYTLDTVGEIERNYVGSYIVDSEPILSVSFDNTDARVNSQGNTQFTVVNRGLSDVKRLLATFTPASGTDDTPHEVYIGDLSADDFDVVSKDVLPVDAEVSYDVSLEYFTTTNERVVQEETVSFTAESEETFSVIPLLLGVILVVGGAAYWWRRRE